LDLAQVTRRREKGGKVIKKNLENFRVLGQY